MTIFKILTNNKAIIKPFTDTLSMSASLLKKIDLIEFLVNAMHSGRLGSLRDFNVFLKELGICKYPNPKSNPIDQNALHLPKCLFQRKF